MIRKAIKAYKQIVNRQENIQKSLNEIEWANIFHDSIKGDDQISNLSLNIGRWAGGYPFFYCLYTILNKVKPSSTLEFGLGESSKLISTFYKLYIPDGVHTVLEHNNTWYETFNKGFSLSQNTEVIITTMISKKSNDKSSSYNSYECIENYKDTDILFYVVDGPIGTKRFSRYDIVELAKSFDKQKKFIILFDDTNRPGEQETLNCFKEELNKKSINFEVSTFKGKKTTTIITSNEYSFLTTI